MTDSPQPSYVEQEGFSEAETARLEIRTSESASLLPKASLDAGLPSPDLGRQMDLSSSPDLDVPSFEVSSVY